MSNGLYTDFDSYRVVTREEVDEVLRSGIVAVDTNVLLSLYRYNEATVNDLLRLLGQLGDRLFVPNQVLREFWRNRQSVLGSPLAANRDLGAALAKNAASSRDAVTRWAKSLALDAEFRDGLLERVADFYTDLAAQTQSNGALRVQAGTPTAEDPVLQRLERILEGRVGVALPVDRWKEAVAEGNRRVVAEEPPGYRDDDKLGGESEEEAAGDYLVWRQLMDQSAAQGLDLILVTSDTKEDWWEKAREVNVGPRRELLDEFRSETSRRVHFLEPADFLDRAPVLKVQVRRSSVEDVERVRDSVAAWDGDNVLAVLDRLDQEGAVQASVIREAAAAGGRISRQRVYELDGREGNRLLTSFTRPVRRITRELQAEGVLPEGLPPLLSSHYESGVKTTHFVIPSAASEILATG